VEPYWETPFGKIPHQKGIILVDRLTAPKLSVAPRFVFTTTGGCGRKPVVETELVMGHP
jgi:hypothetical protein